MAGHRFAAFGALEPLGQLELDLGGAVLPVRQDVGDQHEHGADPGIEAEQQQMLADRRGRED